MERHREKRPNYGQDLHKVKEEKRDIHWKYDHAMDCLDRIQEGEFSAPGELYTREECFTTITASIARLKILRMERAMEKQEKRDQEYDLMIVTETAQIDHLARHIKECKELGTIESREHVHLILMDVLDTFIYETITANLEEKQSHKTTKEEEITQ